MKLIPKLEFRALTTPTAPGASTPPKDSGKHLTIRRDAITAMHVRTSLRAGIGNNPGGQGQGKP
jgi:hypothetical protein